MRDLHCRAVTKINPVPDSSSVDAWSCLSSANEGAGCVLIQLGVSADRRFAEALLFESPEDVLAPHTPQQLSDCLQQIDAEIQRRRFAAGFLTYEAGYALEPKKLQPLLALPRPLAWFGIYGPPKQLRLQLSTADELQLPSAEFGLDFTTYAGKIKRIAELIAAGDVYQVNFTDAFALKTNASALAIYRALLSRHPVEHSAFVNTGKQQIISISPELFFECKNNCIRVKPMKGTARRGRTTAEDAILSERLRQSEKERAENLMIVDLMRNDLGRIARIGSVQVPSLFAIEKYETVFQMTSTVQAELTDETKPSEIVRAVFPCGSVTGAPKIRAMQIIHELERGPRGVYCGSIGYFGPQEAKFNVAIRTIEMTGNEARLGIGSGIVADSIAEQEFAECQAKSAFLHAETNDFTLLESMSWDGGLHRLESHLARLRDSADYFGFVYDEADIRQALTELSCAERAKVRLALQRDGSFEVSCEPAIAEYLGRIGISKYRVSSSDRFLFHKTTHRKLYNEELAKARAAGLDDVLFFNERGELTEGSIHNVFLEIEGELVTPPIECGLLPGVYRAEVLANGAVERVLYREDLLRAQRVFLCNSVRGIYEVKLIADGCE
jgi:para-aminobenzoate synthetase/4-amino-4-deoxychorismate lyase